MSAFESVPSIIYVLVAPTVGWIVKSLLPSKLVASWEIGLDPRFLHFVITLVASFAIVWLIGSIRIYLFPLLTAKFWPKQRLKSE